jgi:hypothetical protein
MRVSVLLQPNLPEGYIATVLGWPDLMVKGKTEDETLDNVRHAVTSRLRQAKFVTLDIQNDDTNDPWMKFVGIWENDPTFDDFQAEIAAYRRELDAQEGV